MNSLPSRGQDSVYAIIRDGVIIIGIGAAINRTRTGGNFRACGTTIDHMLPHNTILVYGRQDQTPIEAEELFAAQLACSRRQAPVDEHGSWDFRLVCAVADREHVLGGVHLDVGPIGGAGPLAKSRLAYLERTLVRPEYRRQGLATALMRRAMQVVAEAGCLYIRCSNNWDNPAERALFLRCGFALVDLDGEKDEEPCYMAVRPVQNISVG